VSNKAVAALEITRWDENPIHEATGLPKLTRASVTAVYQGDLVGECQLEYLMMYRDDGSASYVGLERFVGRISDRSGSLTLQHNGVFEGDMAKGICVVIAGSGTGDLAGIQGSANFVSTASGTSVELEYTLP
jgi:hypothetical protein